MVTCWRIDSTPLLLIFAFDGVMALSRAEKSLSKSIVPCTMLDLGSRKKAFPDIFRPSRSMSLRPDLSALRPMLLN